MVTVNGEERQRRGERRRQKREEGRGGCEAELLLPSAPFPRGAGDVSGLGCSLGQLSSAALAACTVHSLQPTAGSGFCPRQSGALSRISGQDGPAWEAIRPEFLWEGTAKLLCSLPTTQLSLPMESSRSDSTNVRRCLAHSLFMNAAELQPDGTYSTLDSHQLVAIHPSSVLFQCKPACVVYNGLLHTSKCYMRDLCVVDAEWLHEAAPEYFRRRLRAARD